MHLVFKYDEYYYYYHYMIYIAPISKIESEANTPTSEGKPTFRCAEYTWSFRYLMYTVTQVCW